MRLDTLTLMAADSFVAAIGAILLINAWTQMRSASALVWWAAATCSQAIGIGCLVFGFADAALPAIIVGSGFLSIAPPFVWAGTRHFSHRAVWPAIVLAGPASWLVAGFLPLPIDPQAAGLGTSFLCWIAYLIWASLDLWRGRTERLTNRWPLLAMFLIHIAMFLVGLVALFVSDLPTLSAPPLTSLFGAIYFEQLIFTVGTSIFMVTIIRERVEIAYKLASRIDVLTGIANRGAFMTNAKTALAGCQERDEPLSLVLFDLDHFKAVNDTFGHATGDRVLQVFCDSVRGVMRATDTIGRMGGEEFALVLPGASDSTGYVIADRIREAFAAACRSVEGKPVSSTVSAGVAAAHPDSTIDGLLKVADEQLYLAKTQGRNRVKRAGRSDGGGKSTVVRVA